ALALWLAGPVGLGPGDGAAVGLDLVGRLVLAALGAGQRLLVDALAVARPVVARVRLVGDLHRPGAALAGASAERPPRRHLGGATVRRFHSLGNSLSPTNRPAMPRVTVLEGLLAGL